MGLAVSVVIPTWNRAHLIHRSVESALKAVAPEDEILVVDDGSTDGTEGVVRAYGDRIRFLPGPHAGCGPTRNRGVAAATRPLVAFLDSDDEWTPDALRLHRAVLEARSDVLFSFADFAVQEETGPRIRNYLARWHGDPRPWSAILGPGVPFSSMAPLPPGRLDFPVHVGGMYEPELERNYIATFTLVVRRVEAGSALLGPSDLPTGEDWQMFSQIARKGLGAYLDTETAVQHGHAGPRLTRTDPHATAAARLTLVSRAWGDDPAFLADPGRRARYEEVVAQQHRIRARWLLGRGQTAEAREELRLAGSAPLSYRALARVPGPLLRTAVWVRRKIRGEK